MKFPKSQKHKGSAKSTPKTCISVSLGLLAALTFFMHAVAVSAHSTIPTSPSSCGILDSTNLRVHDASQIDQRLALASSTNGMQMYANRDFSLSSSTAWTPNPNSWTKKGTAPLDFTGIAGYILYSNATALAPNRLGTLISPRHFIAANHYTPNPGEVLGFIDASGNRIERTVTNIQNIAGTDIEVGVLDSDLPDSITYYPIMGSTTLDSLIRADDYQTISVPMVSFDQEAKAIVRSLDYLGNQSISHSTYTSGSRAPFSEDIVSGDSGNPSFIIIDNHPVLMMAHYTTSSGPNYGNYISEINAAMTSLGGGYQVSQYNASCFAPQALNHRPVFSNDSFSAVRTIHNSAAPVYTIHATDSDVGQTLSYSLLSLLSSTPYHQLNPSDYFSINSTTGDLYQIGDFDVSAVGRRLILNIAVTDTNSSPASSTHAYYVDVMDPLNQSGRVSLDSNFVSPVLLPTGATISKFAFNPDGSSIVVGNFASVNGTSQVGIAKLNMNGSLNTAFSTAMGTGLPNTESASAVAVDDVSGKIAVLIAGTSPYTFNGTTTGRIVRLNPDGSMDSNYLSGIGTGFSAGFINNVYSYANKLYVTGFGSYNGTGTKRLNVIGSNGALDSSFYANFGALDGSGSRSVAASGNNLYIGGLFSVYTRPDSSTVPALKIAKFNINGTFDEAFGANVGSGFDSNVESIAVRPDGKLVVVGGFGSFNGTTTNRIALLNPDGTLDASFTANTGLGFSDTLYSVAVQPDNKIIVGGNSNLWNITTNVRGLVRLNADGTLDTSFQRAMGDGINGGVTKVALRYDGAVGISGLLSDYNGVSLANGMAVLTTQMPDAPSVPDLLSSYDSGSSDSDNNTTNTTLVFTGRGSSTAIVNLYSGNSLIATSTVNDSGIWYATSTFAVGSYNVAAVQTLSLLNTVTSATSTSLSLTVSAPVSSSSGGGSTGGSSGGGGGGGAVIIYTNTNANANNGANNASTSLLASPVLSLSGNSAAAAQLSSLAAVSLPKLNALVNKNISLADQKNIQKLLAPIKVKVSADNQIQINSVGINANRSVGTQGEDVRQLQKFLNSLGYAVSKIGTGSAGNETTAFGPKTQYALSLFQKANGIKPAQGYFGPVTRAKIAALLK